MVSLCWWKSHVGHDVTFQLTQTLAFAAQRDRPLGFQVAFQIEQCDVMIFTSHSVAPRKLTAAGKDEQHALLAAVDSSKAWPPCHNMSYFLNITQVLNNRKRVEKQTGQGENPTGFLCPSVATALIRTDVNAIRCTRR
jgi:hypothetical protein